MKKVGNWLAASWIGLLLSAVSVAVVVALLGFGLGSMPSGLSQNEAAHAAGNSTLQNLMNNPIGLPHKLPLVAVQQLNTSAWSIRAISALIGLFTVGCFYYILNSWYSRRVAVLGTLLFATSAWFLHTARLGTDDSMYLLLFAAIACGVWLQRSRGSLLAVLASALIVIILLYIPGMVWFVIPALLWQVGRIGEILEGQNAGLLTLLSLLILTALLPIGWTLYQEPELIRTYFGLPQTLPEPVQIIKNFASVPVQLFGRGPDSPETWLARLPLLNMFASVMFIIGGYKYFKKRKLDRTWFVFFVFLVGGILYSLGGPINLAIIMPFVYLVAAGGIALMLQQWTTVFPLNPFARRLGSLTMTLVVLMACFYNLSHYYVAWPNAPETKRVFTHKL